MANAETSSNEDRICYTNLCSIFKNEFFDAHHLSTQVKFESTYKTDADNKIFDILKSIIYSLDPTQSNRSVHIDNANRNITNLSILYYFIYCRALSEDFSILIKEEPTNLMKFINSSYDEFARKIKEFNSYFEQANIITQKGADATQMDALEAYKSTASFAKSLKNMVDPYKHAQFKLEQEKQKKLQEQEQELKKSLLDAITALKVKDFASKHPFMFALLTVFFTVTLEKIAPPIITYGLNSIP